jgi:hypothetical protein
VFVVSSPRAKAILVPSGDHAGYTSAPFLFVVSLDWWVPSAFITTMLVRLRLKAILFPSGDQAGSVLNGLTLTWV